MVLDGAVKLASTQELSSISLDDLSKVSGISAFDIIRQYHSKEKILAAVLERELELIAGSVPAPELRFPGETLRDELQVMAKIMLGEYRSRLPFLGKLLSEAMKNPEVGAMFYRTFIVQGRLLFTEFLNVRKRLGELRDDVDVEASAAFFLSALTFILLVMELFGGKHVENLDEERLVRSLRQLKQDPWEQLVQSMSDLFLRGVEA
jgi:AcrR family transcriptional regulator